MRYIIGTVAAAAAAVVLASCGSGDGDEPSAGGSSATTPAEADVRVVLVDEGGQDVLFNLNGRECTTRNIAAELGGEAEAKVVVTLRDADGTIVGTETLPQAGGDWSRGGCLWPVMFPGVAVGDYAEATVTVGDTEATGTGKIEDGVGQVAVQL